MTYYTSASYEPNSVYESNSQQTGLRIIGQCRGTCYTSQGCTCR